MKKVFVPLRYNHSIAKEYWFCNSQNAKNMTDKTVSFSTFFTKGYVSRRKGSLTKRFVKEPLT